MTDVIIIGGGPAGMTAAIYAARAGKSVIVFEGNKLGGTLLRLKKIVNYPGSISDNGSEIAAKMAEQVNSFGVKVIGEFVSKVIKTKDGFNVLTESDCFDARYVIYCGGIQRLRPEAEQRFKGSGISYCAVCDGNFFRGKTVAVIGDGEAAARDVKYLLPLCEKVYHIHSGDECVEGAVSVKGVVKEFVGDECLKGITVGDKSIAVDGAFIAMGGLTSELISGLELKDGLIVNSNGKTNIDGFFVAGDASYGSMKQVVSACYEGALAASYVK